MENLLSNVRFIKIYCLPDDDVWYVREISKVNRSILEINNRDLYRPVKYHDRMIRGRIIFEGLFEVDGNHSLIIDKQLENDLLDYYITNKMEKMELFSKLLQYKLLK